MKLQMLSQEKYAAFSTCVICADALPSDIRIKPEKLGEDSMLAVCFYCSGNSDRGTTCAPIPYACIGLNNEPGRVRP